MRDGGKVIMPNVEWLNGLYNPSRLTVANGGEFTIGTLRIASGYASQVNLNEGGLIAATRMTISPSGSNQAKFLFNGGRLQSRDGREGFLASASSAAGTEEQWNGAVKFAVGAGGAVFGARRPRSGDSVRRSSGSAEAVPMRKIRRGWQVTVLIPS